MGIAPANFFIQKKISVCKEFREQTEPGYCHCGLYYKE